MANNNTSPRSTFVLHKLKYTPIHRYKYIYVHIHTQIHTCTQNTHIQTHLHAYKHTYAQHSTHFHSHSHYHSLPLPLPLTPTPSHSQTHSAYFEEKGLVRQQLDSFDEFIQNTMQELIDDTGSIRVSPNIQHTVGYDLEKAEENSKKVYEVKFGQVYLSKPTNVEKDQSVSNIFPHEAR